LSRDPRISVVVVNHNGGDLARRAVESLLEQDYSDYELIVVDNASDDESLARILDSPRVEASPLRLRVVRLARNSGCAGGRNAGIQAANGEYLAFLDSDAVAPSGWLSAVAVTMAAGDRVGVVASTSLWMRNPRVLQSQGGVVTLSGHAVDLGFGEPWEFTRIDEAPAYAMGNGMVVRREVFDQVGTFDEACRNYYEDVDFCLRAQLAGYEVRTCGAEPLLHYGGLSNETFGDKALLLERHRVRTALKLYGGALLCGWLAHEAGRLLRGGEPATRRGLLDAWRWNLLRLPSIARSRGRYRYRLRAASDIRGMRPTWGPSRDTRHGLISAPAGADLESGIDVGDAASEAIAYGFYWPEDGMGERFRWTEGLGSLLVRSNRPIQRIRFRLHLAASEEQSSRRCVVVLLDRARDVFFAGQVEAGAPGWQDYLWELDAPRGNYELLLVAYPTTVESHGWRRRLGVAVAAVSAA
jgi:GT2 family glycosyltransferase